MQHSKQSRVEHSKQYALRNWYANVPASFLPLSRVTKILQAARAY